MDLCGPVVDFCGPVLDLLWTCFGPVLDLLWTLCGLVVFTILWMHLNAHSNAFAFVNKPRRHLAKNIKLLMFTKMLLFQNNFVLPTLPVFQKRP